MTFDEEREARWAMKTGMRNAVAACLPDARPEIPDLLYAIMVKSAIHELEAAGFRIVKEGGAAD